MRILLDMGFKGDRTYLHGTSFYDALEKVSLEFTGMQGSFVRRLVFRHFARRLCELSSSPPDGAERLIGEGRYCLAGGAEKNFWLIETTQPVVIKQAYDENALFAGAIIGDDDRSVHLIGRSGNTSIEAVVGLTKILNYRLMPNVSGKWLFGQLDLNSRLPEDYCRLDIRMENAFSGRFSVSAVVVDGSGIGTIRFIVGEV